MNTKLNITYGPYPAPDNLLDLYWPEGGADSVFIFFHGGGLENGSKAISEEGIRFFTDRGIAIASANYRMYPQARFPEYIVDCARAVHWVMTEGRALAGFKKVYIGGSSAGGYLSMMLLCDRHYLDAHGIHAWDIDGYVLDAGQPTSHFNVLRERGADTRLVRIDETAPIYFIDKDYPADRPLPQLLIFAADHDMYNRLEQTHLFIRTLTHFRYPEDHIRFDLMENCTHTQYTWKEDFCSRVADWMGK